MATAEDPSLRTRARRNSRLPGVLSPANAGKLGMRKLTRSTMIIMMMKKNNPIKDQRGNTINHDHSFFLGPQQDEVALAINDQRTEMFTNVVNN